MRLAILTLLPVVAFAAVSANPGGCADSTGVIASPGSGCTVTLSVAGAESTSTEFTEARNAIESCGRGDTIKFTAGQIWYPNTETAFLLKTYAPAGASGYCTITTTRDAELPAEGTAITKAYAPLLPIFEPRTDAAKPIMIIGSSSSPPQWIKLRGLRFRVRPEANSSTYHSGGLLQIGSPQLTSSNTNAFFMKETTTTAIPTVDGSNKTISVVDGTWAVNGMKVRIHSSFGGTPENLTVDSSTSNSITFVEAITVAHATGKYVSLLLASPDAVNYTPTNIVAQHLMFDNENMSRLTVPFVLSGRAITFSDSYCEWPRNYDTDSQCITSTTGVGPYTIRNNTSIGASEGIMFGGSMPGFDTQPDSATIEFNRILKYKERDFLGSYRTSVPIFRGSIVYLGPSQYAMALDTGTTGSSAPSWVTSASAKVTCLDIGACSASVTEDSGARISGGGGIRYQYLGSVGGNSAPKNIFELKTGRNITLRYNGLKGWWNMALPTNLNTNQRYAIVLKGTNYGLGGAQCEEGVDTWPTCYFAKTRNISILNNHIEVEDGGIVNFVGGSEGKPGEVGDYYFKRNLIRSTGTTSLESYQFLLSHSWATADRPYQWTHPKYEIMNNTHYSAATSTQAIIYTDQIATYPFVGTDYKIIGNIFPKGSMVALARSLNDATANGEHMQRFMGCGNPTPCATSQWDKNVAIGNETVGFPADTVWSDCGSTAHCTNPGWTNLLRNVSLGDFRVKSANAFARNGYDGGDVGADPEQVPNIRNLNVTPTDRLVRFSYAVTPVIADIPCTAEVNTYPDFAGTWAGELADLVTHHGKDADDYDAFPRSPGKIRHNIIIGHTVALTASTTYYYRLSCGGWSERGSFTTAATKSGTTTLSIQRDTLTEATWGYEYSRATDTITDAAAMSVASNTATATVTRGRAVYWRSGTGPVQIATVQ